MYWVLCQFCRASAPRRCFDHFHGAGQGAPSCIVRPFICILLAKYFVKGTQLSGLFLLWQCVPVTSTKDSLKSYFCPISRWEGRCPVLQSSSKLVANALQWQHTRETQITNGNIWSLPRWPAEQLPRKLILFSLFVLWTLFRDYYTIL